jgi:hypothetical protein
VANIHGTNLRLFLLCYHVLPPSTFREEIDPSTLFFFFLLSQATSYNDGMGLLVLAGAGTELKDGTPYLNLSLFCAGERSAVASSAPAPSV